MVTALRDTLARRSAVTRTPRTRCFSAVALGATVASIALPARAQRPQRTWDMRLSAAGGFHLQGDLEQVGAGPVLAGSLAFDYHPVPALSVEIQLAGGYIPLAVPAGFMLPSYAFDASASAGFGVHAPFGLRASVRGGAHDLYQELRASIEGEVGWDIFVTPGFSLGPFARAMYVFGGAEREPLITFVFGLSFALGPAPQQESHAGDVLMESEPSDSDRPDATTSHAAAAAPSGSGEDADHDGVSDDRDACPNSPTDATVDARGCPPSASNGSAFPGAAAPTQHHHGGGTHHRRRRRHGH
jgi:hypothetical protein